MIINFTDKTNSVKENFLQSLVLLFLPCETFSESDDGHNKLSGIAYEEDGTYVVDLRLKVGDKTAKRINKTVVAPSVKLQMKNFIGRTFLDAAEELFGYKSPWGIVTGIRPAKLAADYLTHYGNEKTHKILCDEYRVDSKKADLCIKTAENELYLTENLKPKECSLYISIPFCPSKCRYCSFVSSTTERLLALIPEYLDKLCDEINQIAETINSLNLSLKTVYVGGGTPAILTAEQIKKLLFTVNSVFSTDKINEFTFEAGRPDCITIDKLRALSENCVGRISINTQTANNEVLRSVGRKHTFDDYVRCLNEARTVGINCINTDLIAGLPGESEYSFYESVDRVSELAPENITVHAFTLKKSSEYKTSNLTQIDANSRIAQNMVSYSIDKLITEGYEPYYMYRQKNTVGNLDNTGYSKPGYECLYNIFMMGEYHTVFAAGAGAVSKYVSKNRQRIERVFSPKYPYEYLDKNKYLGFDKSFAEKFYSNLY